MQSATIWRHTKSSISALYSVTPFWNLFLNEVFQMLPLINGQEVTSYVFLVWVFNHKSQLIPCDKSFCIKCNPIYIFCHGNNIYFVDKQSLLSDSICCFDRQNYSFSAFHVSFFISSFSIPTTIIVIMYIIMLVSLWKSSTFSTSK